MIFTRADGEHIKSLGKEAVKKPNSVWLLEMTENFQVQTAEGMLGAHAGDFLAYDPISGNVWPVSASYVEQHYVFNPDQE